MIDFSQIKERVMLNAKDLTQLTFPGLMARVSGAVNIVYKHNRNPAPSQMVEGYSKFQVAVATLMIRCVTLLAKNNTNTDIDDLLKKTSEVEGIY